MPGETPRYSGMLSPRYSRSLPSLSCVSTPRLWFPPCRPQRTGPPARAAGGAGSGISGRNASIRRGNSGRGARYRLLGRKPTQTYALAAGRHGWLAISFGGYIKKKKKKEEGKGRGGSTHARTRIQLILPPH